MKIVEITERVESVSVFKPEKEIDNVINVGDTDTLKRNVQNHWEVENLGAECRSKRKPLKWATP